MADPTWDVCLDYMAPKHNKAHIIFTIEGKTDGKAMALLRDLWHFNTTKAMAS